MTNEMTKSKNVPVSDSDARTGKVRPRVAQAPVKGSARDRRVTGYTRVKSGDLKRRSVTRTPDMSNPNARAMNPNVALGSVPVSVPIDKKKAIPVASVHVEPTVHTIVDSQKVAFPYSIVFLALVCSVLFFYMIFNYVQINEHTATVSDLQAEIATLSVEKKELNAKLDKKHDLSYIEQFAREELGMVKLDEITKKYITMDPGDEIIPFGNMPDPSTSN